MVPVWRVSVMGAGVRAAATHPAESHPAIDAALRNLRQAKRDLEAGTHDFGGHRVAALKATNEAISECEQALKFDK